MCYYTLMCLASNFRKKKNKAKKLLKEQPKNMNGLEGTHEELETASKQKDKRTPAQIAFDKMQEKRVNN